MTSHRGSRLLVVAALLLTAACGSTVASHSTAASGQGALGAAPAGTGAQNPGNANAPTESSSTSGATLPGGGTTGLASSAGTSGGTTTDTTGATTPGTATGPSKPHGSVSGQGPVSGNGFTATTIKIGITTASNGSDTAKSLGIKGVNQGDQVAQYQAVADFIDKHGGILGRKIVFARYDVNVAQSANDPDGVAQAACTYFTEDQHVYAVVNTIPIASMRACLAAHHTPTINADQTTIGQAEFDKYADLLFGAGAMTSDLAYKLQIDSLYGRGFFTGWDTLNGKAGNAPMKIGILYPDTVDGRAIWQLNLRYLAAHGLKPTDTVGYPGTLDGVTSASHNAVLRFKQDGITHVIGSGLVFWEDAESQHYRPRYEIIPGGGYLVGANAPAAQMHGAMTVGWAPAIDVDANHDPGDPTSATGLCKSIMKANGQDYTDRTTLASMEQVCDVLFVLKDSLAAEQRISVPALRAGIERLSTQWLSSQTWVSTFTTRRHASASAVRDQTYVDSCSCFAYVSKRNRVG